MARGFGFGDWGRPPRWAVIVLVVGAAVFVGAGAYGTHRQPRDPVSAAQIAQERKSSAKAAATETSAAKEPVAAFLGDSYTLGAGTVDGAGYAQRTAAVMGWRGVYFGQGNTGYTADGGVPGRSAYLGRVPSVIAAHPDIVIVQGSTNDYGATQAAITAAAEQVYDALKAGLPKARIVAVGPLSPPSSSPQVIPKIVAGVREAARSRGVEFIDPTGEKWLQPTAGLFIADRLHPNERGHAEMAGRLVADLRRIGV